MRDYDPNHEAIVACADVVGRSGGTEFEIGYLHDDVPVEEAAWYAMAVYKGAKLIAENHTGPDQAADALAKKVLRGGLCTHCGRTIAVRGSGSKGVCLWKRDGERWVRGCV